MFIHFVLTILHVSQLFHQLRKHIFVCKDAALWNLEFGRVTQTSLLHLFNPSENGIDLESKSPSFWLFVVTLKHVDSFSAKILPVFDRLFDPNCLWDFFSENFQKSGLATANIALNCEAELSWLSLRFSDWRDVVWLVAERNRVEGGIHVKFSNRFYYIFEISYLTPP